MSVDKTRAKRHATLADRHVRDRFLSVPSMRKPPLIMRSNYPMEGPCAGGCGKTILKRSPSQKCDGCKRK